MAWMLGCCFLEKGESSDGVVIKQQEAKGTIARQKQPLSVQTSLPSDLHGSHQQNRNGKGKTEGTSLSSSVEKSLRVLNRKETGVVQETLLQVSSLIQKLAEERGDNPSSLNALTKALNRIAADSRAIFASVHALTQCRQFVVGLASVGLPPALSELMKLCKVHSSGSALEALLTQKTEYLIWEASHGPTNMLDWQQLHDAAGLNFLAAVPIKLNDRVMGLLTMGFEDNDEDRSASSMWPTYCQLVAATIGSILRDPSVDRYLAMLCELRDPQNANSLMKQLMQHMKAALGAADDQHLWFRVGLATRDQSTALLFDDLSQAPHTKTRDQGSRSSCRSLSVSTHNFPESPSSRSPGSRSFGARRSLDSPAMAAARRAHGFFAEQAGSEGGSGSASPSPQSPSLRPSFSNRDSLDRLVAEQQGVLRTLVTMKHTVLQVAIKQHQQVIVPDVQRLVTQTSQASTDIFNTSMLKPPSSLVVMPLRSGKNIYGAVFAMSNVSSTFSDLAWRLREVCHLVGPHLLHILSTKLATEYAEILSLDPTAAIALPASSEPQSEVPPAEDLMVMRSSSLSFQSSTAHRMATGALVTGLTERLNQRRIHSTMDSSRTELLGELQIMHLLGEGGFAKVFRGRWCGLMVAIKVVNAEGRNDRMVVKNAHEIALLSALSHPNIIQAYDCITDVRSMDVCSLCLAGMDSVGSVPSTSNGILKGLGSTANGICHIEIMEYCDLGTLGTALKGGRLSGQGDDLHQCTRLRHLVLTLLEVASAMTYLHRMGVVHCDIKPGNVLLKTSKNDERGFMAKVSDFGLSRVEDDESGALSVGFPFNSCGTAAYVAPEAMTDGKRVDHSVDVYAFGILMYEVLTTQPPYHRMQPQQMVHEVVTHGLRPSFPRWTPPAYRELAQRCWALAPDNRPNFNAVVDALLDILRSPALNRNNAPLRELKRTSIR